MTRAARARGRPPGTVTPVNVPPSPPDPVAAWRGTVDRVCDLVLEAGDERMGATVPACPDWTARDLLSHMVGLGASVLADDEPGDHGAAWTDKHVADRRDRTTEELVAEWRALADDLQAHMREHGTRPLGDVVIHEHDLRGALGEPGAHDHPGLVMIRSAMLQRLASGIDRLPPLGLDAGDWTWTSDGSDVADAPVLLRADGFELHRALVTRRTAEQLRGWTVRGDVGPYLDALAWLGPLPSAPLPPE